MCFAEVLATEGAHIAPDMIVVAGDDEAPPASRVLAVSALGRMITGVVRKDAVCPPRLATEVPNRTSTLPLTLTLASEVRVTHTHRPSPRHGTEQRGEDPPDLTLLPLYFPCQISETLCKALADPSVEVSQDLALPSLRPVENPTRQPSSPFPGACLRCARRLSWLWGHSRESCR